MSQAHRAEKSADGTGKDQPDQAEDADHIDGCARVGTGERILQCAERAGADGAGTGITVQTGYTDIFGVARVDPSVDKSLDICVGQKCRVQLNEPAFGGGMVLEPKPDAFKKMSDLCKQFHINPVLCIPCRY